MTASSFKGNEVVGSWKLQKHLGSGGQAEVWKVRHTSEKHTAPGALKILTAGGQKALKRFEREVDLLRSNKHPHIVDVRDSDVDREGRPFYVMELANIALSGLTHNDHAGIRVLNEAPILMLSLFRQACGAIAHLHANGVLHRDIKPSNILLMLDGPDPMRAAVCDLGISAQVAEQRVLTSANEAIGTPIFRAPEATYGPHTYSSDIYSLGKTLEFIFARVNPSQMGPGRCSRDARLDADAWDSLDAVLARACALEPKQRYESVADLIAALPALVVTPMTRAPGRGATSAEPDVSLSQVEILVLARIIEECPTDREAASVFSVRTYVGEGYASSLAMRRLESIQFIESFEESDRNGEFSAVRPTPRGIAWAVQRSDAMTAAIAARDAERASVDDIPF